MGRKDLQACTRAWSPSLSAGSVVLWSSLLTIASNSGWASEHKVIMFSAVSCLPIESYVQIFSEFFSSIFSFPLLLHSSNFGISVEISGGDISERDRKLTLAPN